MLDKIRIVLIETSHPGNIGATARAMKNMGLSNLALVRPHEFPCAEASARASGATDILVNAMVCETLEEALTGCHFVMGASARMRTAKWPQFSSKAFSEELLTQVQHGEVALIFGREHSGLTNEEMDMCHALVHIPANPGYSSLNVSQAVQVLCYELFQASDAANTWEESKQKIKYAQSEDMERFYEHLYQTLIDIDFLDEERSDKFMRRMRKMYNRIHMEKNELHIQRGILTQVNKLLEASKQES